MGKLRALFIVFAFVSTASCTSKPTSAQAPGAKGQPSQPTLAVGIRIQHLAPKQWRVTYKLEQPQKKLVFERQRNLFRQDIFKADDPAFTVKVEGGNEVIVRNDGAEFKEASFTFGPHYENLRQDYEFTLGFADGSSALYTGHLDLKGDGIAVAPTFEFQPLENENLVFNAKKLNGLQTWKPEGELNSIYVYFGKIEPKQTSSLTILADPQLPQWLKKTDSDVLAKIFEHYEKQFNYRPEPLPFIITNVGEMKDPKSASAGGGSAPGWIQMGISGGAWKKASADLKERYVFMYAHEGMHQYQGRSHDDFAEVGWLMEGGADFFADLAARDLGFMSAKRHRERIRESANECIKLLEKNKVALKSPGDADYKVVYHCGRILHEATDKVLRRKHKDGMVELWRRMLAGRRDGYVEAFQYFDYLRQMEAPETYVDEARDFITLIHENPRNTLNSLLQTAELKL